MMLYGKPVFVNQWALGFRPARQLVPRKWHRWSHGEQRGYAARVNKKWRKRYGTVPNEDQVIVTPEAIIVSQKTLNMLREIASKDGAL